MKFFRRLTGLRGRTLTMGDVPETRGCAGCGQPPLLTHLDPPDNLQAHLTCVNAACPAPRWTSTPPGGKRTVPEAVAEWNGLNGGAA